MSLSLFHYQQHQHLNVLMNIPTHSEFKVCRKMQKFLVLFLELYVLWFPMILLNFITHKRMESQDFDWLCDNNNKLQQFIKPNVTTALILPVDIHHQRNAVCYVMSAPKNVEARNAIRRTWGKAMKQHFVVGTSDLTWMQAVTLEAQLYADIILENFEDNSRNLTLKTMFALKHFVEFHNRSKFFLKVNDDVFINEQFAHVVQGDAIIGSVVQHSSPSRNNLFLPNWLYDRHNFPSHVESFAYAIPGQFIFSF